MSGRAQIFIADLLTTLQALQIGSAATAQAVMHMLSLEDWDSIMASKPADTATAAPLAPLPVALAQPPAPGGGTPAADVPPPVAPAAPPWPADAVLSIRRLPASTVPARPPWLQQVSPLPKAVRASSPAPDPLFEPRQERALLGGLAACLSHDGELHLERLLDDLARGQLPKHLPRHHSWGTQRGLQLLVDDGPGMAPFRADVEQLWSRLCALFPGERLSRLTFEGCPTRGCRKPRQRGSRPWQAPDSGSAVLVLSDLGLAETGSTVAPGRLQEWLTFCGQAEAAGVQLRSLLPYPSHRWPPALVGRLHPVPWDRHTTVAMVRRAVRAAALQSDALR